MNIADANPAAPRWYPTHLTLRPFAPLVHWADLAGVPFNEPFYHQTVRQHTLRAQSQTPLGDAPAPAARGVAAPAAFVFHVSRCGSTLLCKLLRAHAGVHLVAEAQPVTALLTPTSEPCWPAPTPQRAALRDQWLRQIVGYLGQFPVESGRHYIVKHTSYSAMRLALVRRLWPTTRCLFLVRDPVPVVVSNLERNPPWMRVREHPRQACAMFGWSEDSRDMAPEEFLARVFGALCRSALAALGPDDVVLDYQELLAGAWRHCGEALGLPAPTAREIKAMERLMGLYAKDIEGERPFADDSAAKSQRATPAVRAATDRWARPAFDALRERFRSGV